MNPELAKILDKWLDSVAKPIPFDSNIVGAALNLARNDLTREHVIDLLEVGHAMGGLEHDEALQVIGRLNKALEISTSLKIII